MHKTVDTKQYDSLPLGTWWARRLHCSSHQIDLREKYSVKNRFKFLFESFGNKETKKVISNSLKLPKDCVRGIDKRI